MTTEGNSRSVRGVPSLVTFSHGDHFQLLFCDDGERMPIALIRVFCIHSVTSIWYIGSDLAAEFYHFITLSCGPCSIKVSITWHWSEFEPPLPPPPGKLLEFLWKRLSFCIFVVDIWISYSPWFSVSVYVYWKRFIMYLMPLIVLKICYSRKHDIDANDDEREQD